MTTIHSTISAEQLQSFEPVEGTWEANNSSAEERNAFPIAEQIERSIAIETGFKVDVLLFDDQGHAISGDMPFNGNFIATRI